MSEASDFYAILKVQNGRIRRAMEDAGIATASELARAAGVHPTGVGDLLNFKISPRKNDGGWRSVTVAVCDALNVLPDDLFPDHLCVQMEANQIAAYVERGRLPFAAYQHLPGPVEAAMTEEVKGKIARVLDTLTFREREILKRRYALDGGREYTLEECATIFNVSRVRVRQIEAKAIRKMQHPDRARKLEGFL